MIIGINQSKTLTKHISCECKLSYDEVIKTLEMRTTKLSCTTKQNLFQQILMKRKQPVKSKISVFYLHFYQLP